MSTDLSCIEIYFDFANGQTNDWRHVLDIPKDTFFLLDIPDNGRVAYLRYICFAVRGTKGRLSLTGKLSEVDANQLDNTSLDTLRTLYYHTDVPIAPLDTSIHGQKSVTHISQRNGTFANEVKARDNRKCFFTKRPIDKFGGHAAHIVRFNKGDEVRLLNKRDIMVSQNHTMTS
jgi:hypothetical protein